MEQCKARVRPSPLIRETYYGRDKARWAQQKRGIISLLGN